MFDDTDRKVYGEHKYNRNSGTNDCEYGCGCWMGGYSSGGPIGLDPFGICPKNPEDGKLLGGTADYDHVVEDRIRNLTIRATTAERRLERVRPSKIKLADEIEKTKEELAKKNQLLDQIRRLIGPAA